MASRLIKIRLPFLFLFCLEMFKANCLRMSEPRREAGSATRAPSAGPRRGSGPGDASAKSKNEKFFQRLAGNLKRSLLIFQEFWQTKGAERLKVSFRRKQKIIWDIEM